MWALVLASAALVCLYPIGHYSCANKTNLVKPQDARRLYTSILLAGEKQCCSERFTTSDAVTGLSTRGLSEDGEPGNEIESEQIIWRPGKADSEPVRWSGYAWRRGSVPIRWGVVIRNGGLGEAEIYIRRENTFKGTRK